MSNKPTNLRVQLCLMLICAGAVTAGLSCGGVSTSAPVQSSLVIEPDDGRAPIVAAISNATDNIRLTIYQITDLQSVIQSPPAPAGSVVQALIDKSRSGVTVRVIVDQTQLGGTGSTSRQIQQAVEALSEAGAIVHPSSTAFCVTHQKTLVIDGPTAARPGLSGTAIMMSFNLMPGYFGSTRDYAVITTEPGVVQEASRVFDSDFALINLQSACSYTDSPKTTYPPPSVSDTPLVAESNLVWSPVNSKAKLLQLIGSAKKSLEITTEVMDDSEMVCGIQAAAQSSTNPSVRILLSGDSGSNAAAVNTLLGLGLANLSIRVMPGLPTASGSKEPQTPLYMHGKQVIADGVQAFVGSENMTNTSLIQNRELGALFTDPGMIQRLHTVFTSDFTTPLSSLSAQGCTGKVCAIITCPPNP